MDWNLKAVAWVSVLGCLCWAWKQAVPRQPSLGRVGQGPRGGEPHRRDKAETPNSAQGYEVGAPAPLGLLPGWGWEEHFLLGSAGEAEMQGPGGGIGSPRGLSRCLPDRGPQAGTRESWQLSHHQVLLWPGCSPGWTLGHHALPPESGLKSPLAGQLCQPGLSVSQPRALPPWRATTSGQERPSFPTSLPLLRRWPQWEH